MDLTLQQKQTVKAWVTANAAGVYEQSTVNALNAVASPAYWVWRTTVSRSDIYRSPVIAPLTANWSWTIYKGQGVAEQNAWTQMFMGDEMSMAALNNRVGIGSIFTGSAGATDQRNHCLAVGRRNATVLEKLLATAVVSPPANTGNNSANPRGDLTNPDVMGFEGAITLDQLIQVEGV